MRSLVQGAPRPMGLECGCVCLHLSVSLNVEGRIGETFIDLNTLIYKILLLFIYIFIYDV